MILSTGREIDANSGFIGINDDLELAGGYDSRMLLVADEDGYDTPLTNQEAVEIADILIARWTAFRAKNLPPKGSGETSDLTRNAS